MRAALFFLALVVALNAQDANILTGEGLQALLFPGNAGVELSTSVNRTTLSQTLPLSFTFEGWIMLPNPPADGNYKTIVARWDLPADGNAHNRYADFNFQVQASGTLNFFMGNGGSSIYGILASVGDARQGVWSHVAFSIFTPTGQTEPKEATIYYDLAPTVKPWIMGGARQLTTRSIMLGDYFNQDRDHKWWNGYMDEVRFWSGVRPLSELGKYRQLVPQITGSLLAYYRFNDGAGLFLQDATERRFDGRLSLVTQTTTSPVWRVSGAKIHVSVQVTPSSLTTLFLPGFSSYPRGSLGFNYIIESLPNGDGAAGVGRLLADGFFITSPGFVLRQNSVTYESPNATGVTIPFTYYGTTSVSNPAAREVASTTVFIQVGDVPCIPDMCGRCGGDNSTCTCLPLPYNGYNLNDIERILLMYEIEQTLDLLSTLEVKLATTIQTLSIRRSGALTDVISAIKDFNSNCLMTFCETIDSYMDALAAIGPQ